ncbi:MAG TPA: PASTA domain-containing protein [Candidatus Tumulicola sp.]|nr:PASTA domain-containing protein [Candidatus Tumulicola sp.]
MSDSDKPRRQKRVEAFALPPRRESRLGLYALPAAVVLLIVVVVWVVWAAFHWLEPSGNPVEVPKFVGLQFDEAGSVAERAHVSLRVVAHHNDDKALKGAVLGQFPAAGVRVREGRAIDVIVSDGPTTIATPNLSNLSLRDARVELANARLQLGTATQEHSTSVIAGTVTSQRPDPFTVVPIGTKVDVTIATGREGSYVPNFVGLSLTFVKSIAHEYHLTIDPPTYLPITPGARPKDTIVAQQPLPGQPLIPGERIALQVSKGPPATPTPRPTETPSPEPTAIPEQTPTPTPTPSPSPTSALPSPNEARTLRIAVQLPGSAKSKRVKVVLQDASGSRDLYDQMTTGGFTLSFDVTVTGAGTVETYVNGELVNSTPI